MGGAAAKPEKVGNLQEQNETEAQQLAEDASSDLMPIKPVEAVNATDEEVAPASREEDVPEKFTLNWDAVKDLWFMDSDTSRGRSLVELKDKAHAYRPAFEFIHAKYANDGSNEMGKAGFLKFFSDLNLEGLDVDDVEDDYFESSGWPEEGEDEGEGAVEAREPPMYVGELASAVIRVANKFVMQLGADSEGGTSGLASQLDMLMEHVANAGVEASLIDAGRRFAGRDPSFFQPPADFGSSGNPICFLDISIDGGEPGRVELELNVSAAAKTCYNFKCLCTGEKGRGEIFGAALHYKDNVFHRIVPGMCIQAGDVCFGNGTGGESVYGADFEDENFVLSHDAAGILSMANEGPNTNTSQFFITLAPSPSLDGENCAFGRVVRGMDIVEKIGSVETNEEDEPSIPIKIVSSGILP